jgi:hypothetical protein
VRSIEKQRFEITFQTLLPMILIFCFHFLITRLKQNEKAPKGGGKLKKQWYHAFVKPKVEFKDKFENETFVDDKYIHQVINKNSKNA